MRCFQTGVRIGWLVVCKVRVVVVFVDRWFRTLYFLCVGVDFCSLCVLLFVSIRDVQIPFRGSAGLDEHQIWESIFI